MAREIQLNSITGEKKKLIIKDECFKNPLIRVGRLNIYEITRKILSHRGITTEHQIREFLYPSLSQLYNPFLLKDMDIAVDRIIMAIRRKEKIFVVGDYDTDGVTSTSLLLKFFKEIGVNASFYIPTRDEGYGLSLEAIKKAVQTKAGLIITVDNGITSIDEVEFAKNVGIDVIITDHHEPQESLPNAFAVVNPKRRDSKFPFKELSGVGVAFNLIMALRNRLRKMGFFDSMEEPNLKKYLDLVALGTLADIVPLLDENRVCVKVGLFNKKHSTVGLELLKKVSGIEGNLTSKHVGFVIAPKINAAGRLSDASIVVDMFMKEDEKEAELIARKLEQINAERRKLQMQIVSEVQKLAENTDDLVIVAADRHWHKGVIGIVANAISYKYKKPAIIVSKGEEISIGSGRSAGDIDLFSLIKETEVFLERFGGHRMAVGITIKNKYLDKFKERINEIAKERYRDYVPTASYDIECEVSFDVFNRQFLEELSLLEPFGHSNEEPLFFSRNAIVKDVGLILDKYPKYLLDDGTASLWMVSFDKLNLSVGHVYDVAFYAYIKNGYMSYTLKDAFLVK
ncbi:single-stranded-DNA-specific exonuclease RecJ [Hippea alviniae]|uniref:single-stranded-DNA-specific exonuclease RecJ n=1 Tax=Hippea alviniae TaxID=1279027 RepID=UPI0003B40BF3|nr:single-stranded-DNA-specific exonuclease RecJ [Hippea alviniae]